MRGPLHGIPIALKDNTHTTDMPTTGGALAFEGFVPPYEATLVSSLRAAGAVIIAKTSMTELANWIAGPPTPMPGGYNAITGFGLNPYDPRRDPQQTTFDGRPVLPGWRIKFWDRHHCQFLGSQRRFGVSFAGSACSEPRLIELAYAFEQATNKRAPPTAVP